MDSEKSDLLVNCIIAKSLDLTGLQELGLAPAFPVAEERGSHSDSGKEIEADRHSCVQSSSFL